MSNKRYLTAVNIPAHSEDTRISEPSRWSIVISRILSNKMLLIGGFIVTVFAITALFAPFIATHDPYKMHMNHRFSPPSSEFILGTDHIGRDTFSRIIYGGRVSFKVGIISIMIGIIGGIVIGTVTGFIGGLADTVLMRMMDGLMAFPGLLLAIGLVAFMGPGLMTVSISIGIVYIPRFARVMRSAVLAEREKEYVSAARAIGQSSFKILVRHIGPSTISPVIIMATIIFALTIIIEAALSFLGVGMPPPTPSWGIMLDDARRYLYMSIWMPIFPGLAISLAVLGFNLVGDGLRDFLDPKSYRS